MRDVDVIAGPAAAGTAFPLGDPTKDLESMYREDTYTVGASLAGLPAVSVPAGQINGLPLGLQIIGRPFDESTLLRIGHNLQQITDWHTLAAPMIEQPI